MTTPIQTDLNNCDREPIHIPGNIQPHGLLFALSPYDYTIKKVSSNLKGCIGKEPSEILNRSILDLIEPSIHATFGSLLQEYSWATRPQSIGKITFLEISQCFEAVLHRSPPYLLLECEQCGESNDAADLYRRLSASIEHLEKTKLLRDFFTVAASEIKSLTGFDRVMVYQFDDDWHGEVVGESKEDSLEPFLGLHYPASDIPIQARVLYTKNTLRFITNRDYLPSNLYPPCGPSDSEPLDLSLSILRSVSPIHLEYLRNMGVGASMSISLLLEGKLWGLIACHHYSPRFVAYPIRNVCELLARFIALEIGSREKLEMQQLTEARNRQLPDFIRQFRETGDLAKALLMGRVNIVDFLQVQGAAIFLGNQIHRIGITPASSDIMEIIEKISCLAGEDFVISTNQISKTLASSRLDSVASGVLLLRLSKTSRDCILWFRPEQVRIVEWAGDPRKSIKKGDDNRLSPRGSFALWKETIRGQSVRWNSADIVSVKALRQEIFSFILHRNQELNAENVNLTALSSARERLIELERSARLKAENLGRIKDEFVATLSHELRTPLNAVLGWTQLMRKKLRNGDSAGLDEALEIVERNARIQAQMIDDLLDLSRITSGKLKLEVQLLQANPVVTACLDSLQTAANAKSIRLRSELAADNDVIISADPRKFQQILWNLIINAIKFTPTGGDVLVSSQRVGSCIEFSVSDNGKGIKKEFLPYVFEKFRQEDGSTARTHGGLGLGLAIVKSLTELHGGTVRAESMGQNKGATFVVTFPFREQNPENFIASTGFEGPAVDHFDLKGCTVLVVDDEDDGRSLISKVLCECHADVRCAASGREALELLKRTPVDLIISDIGMPEMDGFQLLKKVRKLDNEFGRKACPAIALTAYANAKDRSAAIRAGFRIHLSKPIDRQELLVTVAGILDRFT